MQRARASELETLLAERNARDQFNGVVLLAERDEVVLRRAFGVKDVSTGEALTPATAFEVGSVSKPFTATSVLQLVERAQLNISEPLSRFFPKLPYFDVTILRMLSHTSGLFDVCCQPALRPRFDAFYGKSDPPYTNADYLAFLEQATPELLSRPGTAFSYSNTAYLLLALIVEQVTGRPFDEVLQDDILDPVGLERTYVYSLMEDRRIPDRAIGYRRDADGALVVDVPVATPERPSVFGLTYGDDEVFSTVDDLFSFGRALAAGRLLRPDTLTLAYRPATLEDGTFGPYGLGWRVTRQPNGTVVVDHTGSTNGFLATCTFPTPENDTTLVLLTNVVSDVHAEVRRQAYELLWGG
jgi:CubicO group peptidase (beta-lactamase class C family)